MGFLFKCLISFFAYVAIFSGQLYFRRSYLFFRVITSTQQLLFWSSCFFRASAFFLTSSFFQNNHFFAAAIFFRIATFSEWNFYRTATTWVQDVLYGSYFSEQLPFWRRNCLDWRYLQKSYFFEAVTSAKHQLFQKSYILEKKRIFQKINMRHYTFFSGELTF